MESSMQNKKTASAFAVAGVERDAMEHIRNICKRKRPADLRDYGADGRISALLKQKKEYQEKTAVFFCFLKKTV